MTTPIVQTPPADQSSLQELRSPPAITMAAPGSRPVNVLIVIDHLGLSGGVVHGPARLLQDLLPRLAPLGFNITLCVLRGRHPVAAEFEAAGFPPVFLSRSKWDPRSTIDVARLIRTSGADLVHLMGEKAMLLGRVAARMARRPAIIHLHDTKRAPAPVRFISRRLSSWTHLALGVSDPVTRLAIDEWNIPASRARTLYNGHSIDRFAHPAPDARGRVRAELGIASGAPVVAVLGRMVPEKGHDLLLRAFPRLLKDQPGAVLCIVGDGPTRHACESLAASLGIAGSVRFTGQRADIPDVLAAVDLVALPSRFGEGLPGVAIESIAAGRAVVAFPVAGTVDIVLHERTGLIVPQDDADAMIDGLLRLLRDTDLRAHLEAGGRAHSTTFHLDENVRQVEAIYRETAAARPPTNDER